VRDAGHFAALSVLYGAYSERFVSLPPSIIVDISIQLAIAGHRLDMAPTLIGRSLLVGTPLASALVEDGGKF
jgi:hypothetical protein